MHSFLQPLEVSCISNLAFSLLIMDNSRVSCMSLDWYSKDMHHRFTAKSELAVNERVMKGQSV